MKRYSYFYASAILIFVLMTASPLFGRPGEELTEEFHKTVPINANGVIRMENYNGTVRFLVWDRNEVKVDAVKRARSSKRLTEAKVEVEDNPEQVYIRTKYPEDFCTCQDPASVDYVIRVPSKASLDTVNIVNGSLELDSLGGSIRVSIVNGNLTASNLKGDVKINTVNGQLEVSLDRLGDSQSISLESVNSPIIFTIPPETSAQFKAVSQKGDISNDFGLSVRKGEPAGSDLAGNLGTGSAKIKLNSVKGNITIRRSQSIRTNSNN
jgi:DUF4097 and DUF4098 domain-containing protein YvlB